MNRSPAEACRQHASTSSDEKRCSKTEFVALNRIKREWIELHAYSRWVKRGRGHGQDRNDWLEAEQEIEDKLSTVFSQERVHQDEQKCISLTRLPANEALPLLWELFERLHSQVPALKRLRVFPLEEDVQEAGSSVATTSTEAGIMSPSFPEKKAQVRKGRQATASEQATAMLNADPLAMMSIEDRERHAGKYVVIRRCGETAGHIAGVESTMEGAVKAAQSLPGYQPYEYWVKFVYPRQ